MKIGNFLFFRSGCFPSAGSQFLDEFEVKVMHNFLLFISSRLHIFIATYFLRKTISNIYTISFMNATAHTLGVSFTVISENAAVFQVGERLEDFTSCEEYQVIFMLLRKSSNSKNTYCSKK